MLISSMHLLSCKVNLSWIDVNFSNQNPCMPLWSGVFQFDTFLSVALSQFRCVFTSESSTCTSIFFMLFINSDSVSIYYSKILLHPVVGFSPPLCWLNFLSLFWKILFYFLLLNPVPVSLKFPFFRQYLLIYFFQLYYQTFLQFFFGLFIPIYPCTFFFS